MHLDKLELLGFKSFPEKTILQFSPGISCIIGPNGCGKTNILDAIRWVLGETRMSILRGDKLEEVIFSGTKEIKPLGMAEVNLTIQNDHGVLATPYNQVTITRRLYRSGDSEFYINKTPCRLKDITEMFYDTGLTSGTYSIIEQDMVDIILSDRAEDRRHFFEEAAGITKYKQRKKDALRKLENTEADLLRLEDLYNEVSSQAGALKRQVAKAQKHKQLHEAIQKSAIKLAMDRWHKLQLKSAELDREQKSLTAELEDCRTQEKVLELEREKIRLELGDRENAVRTRRMELAELTDKLHSLETQISVSKEKSHNVASRHAQCVEEIAALENKRTGLTAELNECRASSEELRLQTEAQRAEVEQGERELDEITQVVHDLASEDDNLQAQIKSLQMELSHSQENQIALDLKYSASLEKTEELKGALVDLEKEMATTEMELHSLRTLHAEKNEMLKSLETQIETRRTEVETMSEQIRSLQTLHQELLAKFHHLTAEIDLTAQIIQQYEGYTSGAAQLGKIKDRFAGIKDTVANLIDPQPEYATAVQTVLGELSNYFVVDSKATAAEILACGRREKLGRFGLIILENIPQPSDPEVSFPNHPNIIGQLSSFVSSTPEYRPLVDFLFKDILVAHDIFEEKGLPGCDLVTPEGEMLDFEKTLAIGGTEEILLVGRRARYDELLEAKRESEQNLQKLEQDLESTDKVRSDAEGTLAKLAEQAGALKTELAAIHAAITQNELKLRALTMQLNERRQISAEIEQRLRALDSEKIHLTDQMGEKRLALQAAETRAQDIRRRLDQAARSKDDFARELSGRKMKLISLESALETSGNNYRRLLELAAEIEQVMNEKAQLISELTSTAAQISRQLKDWELDLERLYQAREQSSRAVIEAEGEINEISGRISEFEKRLKALRSRQEALSDQNHAAGMKINSLNSQQETLAADTLERHGYDLPSQSRIVDLGEEERVALESELQDLRQKMEALGPVNLLALEEYDQVKSRADFLKNQIDDLNRAKEDLRLTISRINTTARKMFMDTFEVVNRNFQDVFSELFEGGEATLRLEEAADPLEAAIHISARPRGKKLLSIHQLSGGERALTATALLFSFYMVKPSPFCILDEVDAPLDDANIRRFLKLIKRFIANTQFIVITHNKLTMEAASTLYGITMSRPGISQIVSVDLKKMEESAAFSKAAEEKVPGNRLPADDKAQTEEVEIG